MAKGKKGGSSKPSAVKSASKSTGRIRQLTRAQKKAKAKKSTPLPGSFRLVWQVLTTIRQFWKPLGGILLVYLALNIVFTGGLSNLNASVNDINYSLNSSADSGSGRFSNALSGFGSLFSRAGSDSSQTSSILTSVLIVLQSLVIIWALRQLLAGKTISVKQAYYLSMAPLIPFLLVTLVILVQLIPVTFGTAALGVVLTSIFNSSALISVIFGLIFAALAAWSIYMLSSSIFALYIVTLPDMQPRQALRSAKNLVRFRRWQLMRRLVFLPLVLLVVMGVVIVPLIIWATPLVSIVFYCFSILSILFIHTYLYSLYRSLLT